MSWLLHHRRLALRYDRSGHTLTALALLACTLICARFLQRAEAAASAL